MEAVTSKFPKRKTFSKIPAFADVPDLLSIQTRSYQQFLQEWTPNEARQSIGLEGFLKVFFLLKIPIETIFYSIKDIILVNQNIVLMSA